MPSYSINSFIEKLQRLKRRTSQHHSAVTVVLAEPPRPTPEASPPQSTAVSTIYRNTSDAAQTLLPPIQAVASVIPVVGSIINGAISGILSILQLVDRYIQNRDDLGKLTLRLHLLRQHLDNAPVARTTIEKTLRLQLLSALQTAKFELEGMQKRVRGAPTLAQDITGCIATLNNHLFEYMVLSQMQLQNDVFEIKTSIVECHTRQMRLIENSVATGAATRFPRTISHGYAILVDATGREHPLLLDYCRHLDQLDAMLSVILYQCSPDEERIQRWFIERKQYDFVVYNTTNSDVFPLTRQSDMLNMRPGTRIVLRVITEEVIDSTVTATYKCPCGTPSAVNVNIEDIAAALQWGCTITCRQCERRFQILRTRRQQNAADNTTTLPPPADIIPTAEAKRLIRNFLAKQVTVDRDPAQMSLWQMLLDSYVQSHQSHLSWSFTAPRPPHNFLWIASAYVDGNESGSGEALDKETAMEHAAEVSYLALMGSYKISSVM